MPMTNKEMHRSQIENLVEKLENFIEAKIIEITQHKDYVIEVIEVKEDLIDILEEMI